MNCFTLSLLSHISPHCHPATSIGRNSARGKVSLVDRFVCRFAGTKDSPEREDIPIAVTIFPPEINLNQQRDPDCSQEGQKEINGRECDRCVDGVTLRRMQTFSSSSNTIPEFSLRSNSETHPLDDQKEEYIVEPVENQDKDIKQDGPKLPSENDANWKGCYGPSSLV